MTAPGPRNAFDRLRPVRRLLGPVEAAFVRRFGRSPLSVLFGTPVLVLHTTGRRSGATRATTLAFHEDEDGNLLIVGGAGGQARVPDWVLNLRATPDVAVTVRGRRSDVRAEELEGADHADTWRRLAAVWPQIETYRRRAGRRIPVFRLVRRRGCPRR